MRRIWLSAALCCIASSAALAQNQLDPKTMQALQNAMQGGQIDMQQIQQVLGNQTINMREQRAKIQTDCNDETFMKCQQGYNCTSKEVNGAASHTVIKGRANGLCYVSISNDDGSHGECAYTDATMEAMLRMYRADTITVAEAMDGGTRMMRECKFVDAQGKPFAMPSMGGMNMNSVGGGM